MAGGCSFTKCKNASLVILIVAIFLLIVLLIVFPFFCIAATGDNSCKGTVKDVAGKPLAGVMVQIPSLKIGIFTDSNGTYRIEHLPAGIYQITVLALNYGHFDTTLPVNGSCIADFKLVASLLKEVTIKSQKLNDLQTISQTEITGVKLMETRGSVLGETLKSLPGVNAIQTGPSLSKPVIHGLHSNRVLIMNNGVRQEGQQWGSEHAPEIDPFIANKMSVIKGAASVRYGSDAIGGVVLVQPDDLLNQKGISGNAYLVGASNGKMGAVSATLQGALGKKLSGLSWRIQGTGKAAGNFHTPHYYLTNTGLREGDFSIEIGYKKGRFETSFFYSSYYSLVGVFLGAESGNLKELISKYAAGAPDIPSFFRFTISRPDQSIMHELLKSVISYDLRQKGRLDLTFGRQNDIRQEYDELSTATTIAQNMPQLKFQLVTHSLDLILTEKSRNGFSGSFGLTSQTSGNVFEGVRSLIPNYRDYNLGGFLIERYRTGKWLFESGIRYDYRWLRVYERNPSTLNLYNVTYQYLNATGTLGCIYNINDRLSAIANVGSGWRAPSINEMYIYGEHFSDASFQVGDSNLKSERSINTGVSLKYTTGKIRAVADLYYNKISNYIYDKPALRVRVLASGAFPEFDFTQANVRICGIDLDFQYDIAQNITLFSKSTVVRGYNENINNWLISMPSDRFENGLEYRFKISRKISRPYVSVDNVCVARQTRVPPNSDYVTPPAGYALFDLNAGFTTWCRKSAVYINFAVKNFTNVAYRDYLDHFRYYADELGVNYVLRVKISF